MKQLISPSPAGSNAPALIGILTPAVIQLASIIAVVAIVMKYDGSTELTVIQALLAIVVPNAIAGGAASVAHIVGSSKTAQAQAQAAAMTPDPVPAVPAVPSALPAMATPADIIGGAA